MAADRSPAGPNHPIGRTGRCGAPRHRLRGRDGFTLVEALAAFAIVAMLTLVVQRGLVMARTGLARSSDRVAAEWVARTLLAEPLGGQAVRSGASSGTAGGLRWTMRIESLDLPAARAARTDDGRAPAWQPMRVMLQVETAPGRTLDVETVRLARVE